MGRERKRKAGVTRERRKEKRRERESRTPVATGRTEDDRKTKNQTGEKAFKALSMT